MSSERGDAGGYLGWFLFGAVLGAAVALLTTPRTGRENRHLLTEHGGDVAKRAQEWAGDAQTHAGEWLDKSREMFEEQTQRLMNAFEEGKEAMRQEIRKWSSSARG
ncbi:MAG: YtxH domain-containing protein [Candidatus Rokuibacteriota bacterium]